MTLRFGAFLSVALLPHPSAQNDWPAYGHDSGVGGLTATGGGIVLIAATNDARLRAFDSRTGKELWTGRLNTSGNATPVTYLGKDGQQYVVIAAGVDGGTRRPVRTLLAQAPVHGSDGRRVGLGIVRDGAVTA